MTEAQMIAHVTPIHEAQKKRRAEANAAKIDEQEAVTTVQVEASAKVMDDTIVRWVLIDLTNIGVMDEIGETSNAVMDDEVEPLISDPASKQSTTSNDATFRDKGDHDVVIVYFTSSVPTLSIMHNPSLSLVIRFKIW